MSDRGRKAIVRVVIAGEEYSIRSDAAPDYTRECAEYVDSTLMEILRSASLVEARKAAILAALSITDQLFRSRAESDALRREIARLSASLAAELEAAAGPGDLASPE